MCVFIYIIVLFSLFYINFVIIVFFGLGELFRLVFYLEGVFDF